MIKSNRLARAVAHWTGFESACDRESLLSEASLAIPAGQCLKAMPRLEVVPHGVGSDFEVVPEYPYTTLDGDADFVVRLKEQPNPLLDVIEMKIVRSSGRNFSREIFGDILRLESVPTTSLPSPLGRWLLIAGTWEDLQRKALEAEGNEGAGGGRVKLFALVLSQQLWTANNPVRLTVSIKNSTGAIRRFWGRAQRKQKLAKIPSELLIDLRAKFPPNPEPSHYTCMIWRILRSDNREELDLSNEVQPDVIDETE